MCIIVAAAALATPQFNKLFDQTYKPKAGTALAKAGCTVCHAKAGSTQLNPYGKSLAGKPVTVASLRSVEKLDSDKDGYNNITEIKAGTLPGNPKSHPTKKAVTKATAPKTTVDPVCHMKCSANAKLESTYKGQTYYFCSKSCKDKFDKDPAKYAGKKK